MLFKDGGMVGSMNLIAPLNFVEYWKEIVQQFADFL